MSKRHGLSKSRITLFEQCPKRLWLSVHRPEVANVSASVRSGFADGHRVGELACRLVPGGIMIDDVGISRYELDTGRHALARSRQKATRSFAQMMIRDHMHMMAERPPMLSASGPANALAGPLSQMLDTLTETARPGLNAAYKRGQIAAHEEALKVHRAYAARGSDPALRAMAQRAIPAIQKHLETASKLPGG